MSYRDPADMQAWRDRRKLEKAQLNIWLLLDKLGMCPGCWFEEQLAKGLAKHDRLCDERGIDNAS